MNQEQDDYPTNHRQRVLETTLVAVRDKNNLRRKNRNTLICGCFIIAVVGMLFFHVKHSTDDHLTSQTPESEQADRHLSVNDNSQYCEVSISSLSGVRTMTLSHRDLARLVYDPSFKFTEEEGLFTWRSESVIIHMPMPRTSMVVTDTDDLGQTDDDFY